MSSHIPFDGDMASSGKYIYSGPHAQVIAVLANASQSRMIHRHLLPSDRTLIDVGCGDGFYTKEFSEIESLKTVLGIDLSSPATKFAQLNWGNERLNFECKSVEEMIRSGDLFDVAVVRGVLHHAEEPKLLLKSILEIAERVIVLEPNGLNPILKIIEKTSSYHLAHGERSFSPRKIKSWANGTNSQILAMDTGVLVPFFCPSWLARILKRFEGFIESMPIVNRVVCGANVYVFGKNRY